MTPSTNNELDGKTFAIGVLSVTACILFVGLVLVIQQPARAIGQLDSAGDYKVLTQQVSRSEEAVVVVDGAAKRAIIYAFDYTNKKLEVLNGIPLDKMPTGEAKPPENAGGRRR